MMTDHQKVLIVDDEANYVQDFKSLFSDSFNILTATSGAQALSVMEKEKVAVLVTDQRMPKKLKGRSSLCELT